METHYEQFGYRPSNQRPARAKPHGTALDLEAYWRTRCLRAEVARDVSLAELRASRRATRKATRRLHHLTARQMTARPLGAARARLTLLAKRSILALLLLACLASPALAGQLTLSWTDTAVDEQGFKVERCQVLAPALSCDTFMQIASVADDPDVYGTKVWVSKNLAIGTTWCYRVRAYNAAGHSGYSNEACGTVAAAVPPADPANLAVQ